MLKLLRYAKVYWKRILLMILLLAIQATAELALPDFMANIIDEGIVARDQGLVVIEGLKMLGIAFAGGISSLLVVLMASQIGAGFSKTLRSDVFEKVESFSDSEFSHFSTASLITRTTNDIQQIQMVIIMGLRIIFYAPIIAVGGVFKAADSAPSMTWIMALAVVLLITGVICLFAISKKKFRIIQKLVDKLNLVTREQLTGMTIVRAFDKEEYEEGRFDDVNKELTKENLFVNRLMSLMMPFMMIIMNLSSLAIVWFGSIQVDMSNMMVGGVMAYIQYTMQVIMAFMMMTMVFIMVPRASVSAERILEVLEEDLTVQDKEDLITLPNNLKGIVEFDNVSFQYPNAEEPVVHNISFTAKPGETTAIIGSTGSGKSTIVSLIPRLYDVTEGSIKIDGVDIRDIGQEELRDVVGFVPQKGVLFSGTIVSNIAYGKEGASAHEVEEAAEIAQAKGFIENKEEGYESVIAQGGSNVSGGQRQRLSIARALVKNAKINIFDDSFSALDYKTDIALRKELSQKVKDTTTIIVAQRISTIMDAENILVIEGGEFVGQGTHKELLKTCEVYREIALSQLSEEELG